MSEDYIGNLTVNETQSFDSKIRYVDIDVNGEAVFRDVVDCECFNVDGKAECLGLVTCDDFVIGGSLLLKKRLMCRNAVFSGKAEIFGNVNSDIVNVGGLLAVGGSLSTINMNVSGKLLVNRKTVADRIHVSGAIESKSKVRTLELKLLYYGDTSRLVRLDCEYVDVHSKIFVPVDYALTCDEINCHLAVLEYAKVDYLFCDTAKIGKGSYIRKLECHTDPEISDGAIVEEIVRY